MIHPLHTFPRWGFFALAIGLLILAITISFDVAPLSASPDVQQSDDFDQHTLTATNDVIYAPYLTATPTRTPTPINIGNFVWDDYDSDGRQDAGEPGIGGVTVQLWNSSKTQLIAQTTTNANGNYTVVAPVPGSYRVRVLLPNPSIDKFTVKDAAGGDDLLDSDINPSGTNLGFTDIFTLASNVISTTKYDAGIIKFRTPTPTRTPTPINIGNFVWNDLNENGSQDQGEPGLVGITVQLWNGAKTQLIDQTTTNSNGNYTVIAPIPGSYRVRVLLPSGALFAPKNLGGDNLKDSDINPSGTHAGFTDPFTIAANVISITSYDAGLIRVPNTPTPTPVGPGNDTLALYGKAVNMFSLVSTLQESPSLAGYNTFVSNAPVKGQFVMGDWDGDGQKTPGLFKKANFWYTDQIGPGALWHKVQIGNFGVVIPVVGRFDPIFANDCFGVVQTENVPAPHVFRLRYTCELESEVPPSGLKKRWLDTTLPGTGAYQFVAGDWDGDGLDSIAIRRDKKIKWGNVAPSQGAAVFTSKQKFRVVKGSYGRLVAGDWNDDGIDTFGLFFKSDGTFYRRDDLNPANAPAIVQNLGKPVGNAVPASWRKTGTFLPLTAGEALSLPLPLPADNTTPSPTPTPTAVWPMTPTPVYEPTLSPTPTYWPTPTLTPPNG